MPAKNTTSFRYLAAFFLVVFIVVFFIEECHVFLVLNLANPPTPTAINLGMARLNQILSEPLESPTSSTSFRLKSPGNWQIRVVHVVILPGSPSQKHGMPGWFLSSKIRSPFLRLQCLPFGAQPRLVTDGRCGVRQPVTTPYERKLRSKTGGKTIISLQKKNLWWLHWWNAIIL